MLNDITESIRDRVSMASVLPIRTDVRRVHAGVKMIYVNSIVLAIETQDTLVKVSRIINTDGRTVLRIERDTISIGEEWKGQDSVFYLTLAHAYCLRRALNTMIGENNG